MISANASNWVNRGEPAERKLTRVLRHFLEYDPAASDLQLGEYAGVLEGMVAADASEVQVAGYLGHVEDQLGRTRSPAAHRRLVAIAVWHIAKAALIRDDAVRLLRDGVPPATSAHARLSDWLAERILRKTADDDPAAD